MNVEVKAYPYNPALPVWAVLVDGVIRQCFETEQAAQAAADEIKR